MTHDEPFVAKLGQFHQQANRTHDVILDAARSFEPLPLPEAVRALAAKLQRDLTTENLAAALAYMSVRQVRTAGWAPP